MMCKNINKNKRGFSLVELMVVVAIMGTLAAIAIPAYNEYRKSAKKAAYRSDLNALHKGWLAFGVELDSFCERETSPVRASIKNVGMASLLKSKLYGGEPGKANLIGFGAASCSAITFAATTHINIANADNDDSLAMGNAVATTDAHCDLDTATYKMGVFGHLSGVNFYRAEISHEGVVIDGDRERGSGTPDPLDKTGFDHTCA